MNKKHVGASIFGIIIISITLFLALTGSSRQQKPDISYKTGLVAELYKKLYFARLMSDIAMDTAVLQRIDQNEYQTAKNVMLIRLAADLDRVNSETNFTLSEEEKKAKLRAEQYRKENEKR